VWLWVCYGCVGKAEKAAEAISKTDDFAKGNHELEISIKKRYAQMTSEVIVFLPRFSLSRFSLEKFDPLLPSPPAARTR